MSSTYYTSLSGMMAASYGLQNASYNIANLQSHGFKRSDVFYSSLGDNSSEQQMGSGVYVAGKSTNFGAGNYLSTENPSDLAIVGNGFFIVKLKNGELLYTRNGDFEFNQDHYLIDKHSKGLVQGYGKQGELMPICELGSKINTGKATHTIDLHGEFIWIELEKTQNPDPTASLYEHISFDVENVYDKHGKKHTIALEFEAPHSPVEIPGNKEFRTWNLISATCKDANISLPTSQFIAFEESFNDNEPAKQGENKITLTLNDSQAITLNFGDSYSDADSSVRLYKKDATHTKSNIDVKSQDGYGFGKQIGFSFDDNGQISYQYSNGQTEEGDQIALAMFEDMEHTLVQANDNLFRANHTKGLTIGRANKKGLGTIQPKKIESANVDSTTEFANILVLQRMFQACSQIMDIDKQLLEGLYKK